MANILASLTLAGILQRAPRGGLRVTPRFLAHAEGIAAGRPARDALQGALESWQDFRHDAGIAAGVLEDLLGDRHQLGALHPVFSAVDRI